MNAKATTPAQSRAPEPTVDRIEELAGRILKGDILLPKFQRDFVWDKPQIIDLLDSIANNYPVGSVLLWRSRQPLRSERNIADLQIAKTQTDYPVNYLLETDSSVYQLFVAHCIGTVTIPRAVGISSTT